MNVIIVLDYRNHLLGLDQGLQVTVFSSKEKAAEYIDKTIGTNTTKTVTKHAIYFKEPETGTILMSALGLTVQ